MKVVSVQGVRNGTAGAIGKGHIHVRATEDAGHGSVAVWVHRPIPVRKSHFVGCLHSLLPSCTLRVLVRNIHGAIVQDLLEESEIRPMPRTKQAARVRTVAHHVLVLLSSYTIPGLEWNAMNTCDTLDECLLIMEYRLTRDLIVGGLALLVHGLESSQGLYVQVPSFRIFFKITNFLSWVHTCSLHTHNAEVAVVHIGSST
jgi:hypothetical protein